MRCLWRSGCLRTWWPEAVPGRARPNVNDVFPDPVTNVAQGFYAGGGPRVPLTSRVEVFADLRVLLMIERDSAHAMLPVRAGLAWRF